MTGRAGQRLRYSYVTGSRSNSGARDAPVSFSLRHQTHRRRLARVGYKAPRYETRCWARCFANICRPVDVERVVDGKTEPVEHIGVDHRRPHIPVSTNSTTSLNSKSYVRRYISCDF